MIKNLWADLALIIKAKTGKNALSVLGSNLVNTLLGFITTVILVRTLGPASFGMLALSLSVMNIAAQFTDLGINVGLVRFVSGYLKENKNKAELTLKISFEIKLIFGLIVLAAGYLLSDTIARSIFHKPELSYLIKLAFIGSYGATLYGFVKAELQAFQWFKKYALVNIIWNSSKLILIVALFYLNTLNLHSSLLATIATGYFGFFLGSFFISKNFLKAKGSRRENFWELIHFSKWVIIFNFALMFFNQLNILMLSAMNNAKEVGYYATGMKLTQLYPVIAGSLSTALLPKVSAFKGIKDLSLYIKKIFRFIPWIIISLAIVLFISKFLIIGLFGNEYANSVFIFQILAVYYSMYVIMNPINLIIYYFKKPQFLALISVIQLILSAVGNWFLIPLYGGVGAAYATLAVGFIIFGVIITYILMMIKRLNNVKKKKTEKTEN